MVDQKQAERELRLKDVSTTIGIALRTDYLSDEGAKRAIADLEEETGLPMTDVVRYGAEKIGCELW